MMKRGQVLIGAVFVMIIVALLGRMVVSLISTQSFSAYKNLQGIQALNVAEGGIRFTVASSLAADTDWSNNTNFGPVSLSPGTFTIRYLLKGRRTCWIEVAGTVRDVTRVVRFRVRKGAQFPYQFTDFAAYAGGVNVGGPLTFQNASKIIGSFFYFGSIIMQNSFLPVQSGGIIESVTISPPPETGIPSYYEAWEPIASADLVSFDPTYYNYWLTVAATGSAANLTLNGANRDLNGGTLWVRNLDMKNGATLTGPGTLCATESINANDSVFIGKIRLVCRGTGINAVLFDGTTYWTATAEVIAMDQLNFDGSATTSANSILYSSGEATAVLLQHNTIVSGALLAPYGLITSKNSGWIRGLTYAKAYDAFTDSILEGGAVLTSAGTFHNQTQVIQNPDVLPPTLPLGVTYEGTPSSSFEIYGWKEAY
jgi:hypothetical protein